MTPPRQGEEQADEAAQVSATKYDRLEALANAAAQAAHAKQWRARRNGMVNQGEPGEVRNLTHDPEAKAQAEAAMQKMIAKAAERQRGR